MRYHRFAEHSIADGIEMSGVVCVSAHSNTQFGEIESYTVCMSRALKQWNILNYRKSAQNEERARNVFIVHTVHTQAAILDVLQFIPTTFVFHEQTLKRCMSINPSISAREMMMRFMFYFTTSVRHKFWWFSIWIVRTYRTHIFAHITSPRQWFCDVKQSLTYRRLLLLYLFHFRYICKMSGGCGCGSFVVFIRTAWNQLFIWHLTYKRN